LGWRRRVYPIREGHIISDNSTVKRRLPDLLENRCITIAQQRSGPNAISVHLPSEIPRCLELLEQERSEAAQALGLLSVDQRDYYSDPGRRLAILERDGRRCFYCTIDLSEDTFVLDHVLAIVAGGTNRKSNLITACSECNRRKSEHGPIEFLLMNYRNQLLNQREFLSKREEIEARLAEAAGH
jgi:hypothetical protein